jgi:cystathionine gamma-synthase
MADRRALLPETLAAQGLGEIDRRSGGLVPPINPSTTYEQQPDGSYRDDRVYTRADNPTYEYAERLLATLEVGCGCAMFASGMAATTAIFQSLVPGDHVLVARVLYWGVRKWLAEFGLTWGLDVEFVDTADLEAVERAIRPGRTRLLWVETPANPTWDITDLATACEIAQRSDVRVVVDNTIPTPVLTRPIELGADLVVHSATKYLNGHSDVLAGAVVTARLDPFWERVRAWRRNSGAVAGPFEAWLLQRGMRTLFLRVRRASETALMLAEHFTGHPALTDVLYPGLPSHPGHAIAARQMVGGFGGMLSIRVRGGAEQARAVVAAAEVFKRATSLGGVESLIEHRRSSEGPSSPVPDDLLRLSVGIEAPEDLIADLEAALEVVPREVTVAPSAGGRGSTDTSPKRDVIRRIAAALEPSIVPSVIARGGGLRVASFEDGLAILEASGSPGAVQPVISEIERVVRAAVPEVRCVRLVAPGVWGDESTTIAPSGDLAQRVQRVLDREINPSVAAHHGRITLVDIDDGRARIRLEGGCQGCSLAAVTVRQGIEPVLHARFPELVGVVDTTDHQAGTEPFFSSAKR